MTIRRSPGWRKIVTFAGVAGVACGGDAQPDHDNAIGQYAQEATLSACSKSVILANTPPERLAIINRGLDWIDQRVLYSQTPQSAEGGYRTDCSGFVSMCWGFGAPGNTTYSFAGGPWDDRRSHRINWADLEPGDALNDPQHHIVLFAGWLDEAHTRLCAMEEYNWGEPASLTHHSVYENFEGVPFHSAFLPIRFDANPPGVTASTGPTSTTGGTSTGGTSTGGAAGRTCYSNTLSRAMPEDACVQSRFDHGWYQCVDGAWRSGEGTNGTCTSTNPLQPTTTTATCFSYTLGRTVTERTCLQARLDSQWYQCTDTGWVTSPSIATDHTGTIGACSDWFPL